MGAAGIEYLAGQLKRAGAAHRQFQRDGQTEFHQHHRPNRRRHTTQGHASHGVDSCQNAGRAGQFHEEVPVDDIQAVEHIGVDRDNDGQQGEDRSLKLISRHFRFSFFAQKNTHRLWCKYWVGKDWFRDQIYVPSTTCVVHTHIKFCILYFNIVSLAVKRLFLTRRV